MEKPLEFDEETFRQHFGRDPFEVRHRVHEHPLLTFDAVAELANALPRQSTGRLTGQLPVAWGERDSIPRGQDSEPAEIVHNISNNASRLMLWEIEQLPAYKELIDSCLDQLEASVLDLCGDLRERMVRMFVSSPGSVTPAHFDVEHNLILQIRGTKMLSIGRYETESEENREIERWWDDGCSRNLETLPPELVTYELKPGMGAYIPMLAPHWTLNGDEPSVTLSMFFRTRASQRYEAVQSFNVRLRRLGLSPKAPERSHRVDVAKAALVRVRALATRSRTSRTGAA